MLKFIFAAIWICAATIGSMYVAFSSAKPANEAAEPPPPLLGGLDFIKTEVISVPILEPSGIDGYFLTRLVYTAEQAKLAKLSVPAETLLVDAVYTHLYSNPQVNFARHTELDLDAFRKGIKDAINARVGEDLIHDVMVEQIDFLTKEEIRDNTMRRKKAAVAADIARDHAKGGDHGEKPKTDAGH